MRQSIVQGDSIGAEYSVLFCERCGMESITGRYAKMCFVSLPFVLYTDLSEALR
jgi:hypothetical protein